MYENLRASLWLCLGDFRMQSKHKDKKKLKKNKQNKQSTARQTEMTKWLIPAFKVIKSIWLLHCTPFYLTNIC